MLLPPRDSTAKHSTIVELTWRREIAKIEGGGFALLTIEGDGFER